MTWLIQCLVLRRQVCAINVIQEYKFCHRFWLMCECIFPTSKFLSIIRPYPNLIYQGTHATFLDLNITISDGLFVYKHFDKRDDFPFFLLFACRIWVVTFQIMFFMAQSCLSFSEYLVALYDTRIFFLQRFPSFVEW